MYFDCLTFVTKRPFHVFLKKRERERVAKRVLYKQP